MLDLNTLFNESEYLAANSDVSQAVSNGLFSSGLEHFQQIGQFENRDPSSLFDTDFYLASNPDVAAAVQGRTLSPIEHFLEFGQSEQRDPIAGFNTSFYLANAADVAAAVANQSITAYQHYLTVGQSEGRQAIESLNINVLFNESEYLAANLDVSQAVSNGLFSSGLEHFQQHGQFEGRDPSSLFDTDFYLESNPDVAAAVQAGLTNPIEHFVEFGQFEQRDPITGFNTSFYLANFPDVATSVGAKSLTTYEHYVKFGQSEGRAIVADPNTFLLTNGNAETGDITGWTQDLSGASSGNSNIVNAVMVREQIGETVFPFEGDWLINFAGEPMRNQSDIDNSVPRTSFIFQEGTTGLSASGLQLTGWYQDEFGDFGEVFLKVLDAAGNELAMVTTGAMDKEQVWSLFDLSLDLSNLSGTADRWRVELHATVVGGRFANIFYDNLALKTL